MQFVYSIISISKEEFLKGKIFAADEETFSLGIVPGDNKKLVQWLVISQWHLKHVCTF